MYFMQFLQKSDVRLESSILYCVGSLFCSEKALNIQSKDLLDPLKVYFGF